MKKILSLLLLLSLTFALVACGESSDVPEGMQLARGGEDVGYYFYVPEEWSVSRVGDVVFAHVSAVNRSSVSYTEVAVPKCTPTVYFEDSLTRFPEAPSVSVAGENAIFGNADRATKFVYSHVYQGTRYGVLQVIAEFEDRWGIFTYTAENEAPEGASSRYDAALEKVEAILENFRFVPKTGSAAKDDYETDADGWRLISDKATAGFALYIPGGMTPIAEDGFTSARYADGANVTMTRAVETGVSIKDYWEKRKEGLSNGGFLTSLCEIEVNKVTSCGNAKNACSYEYTFENNGAAYHVYQIFAVSGTYGYAFTYTAPEEAYAAHLDEIMTMTEKVVFR